jgi:hypothetical protein
MVMFFIPRQATSQNARRHNSKTGFAYRKERERWLNDLRAQAAIPSAVAHPSVWLPCKRRVMVTRLYCGRQRQLDYGNLVGGFKPAMDAMVQAGWLVDDSPRWLEDHYQQRRSDIFSGVEFRIEELING